MSLPTLASAEDIDTVVGYLRNKPTGATMKEAKAVIQEAMDHRKLAAFIFWGIISKEGEKIKLAPRGWELARKTKGREQILREILDSVVPYRSALEWLHHQKLESATNSDIASHWHEHHSDSLGSDNENTIKEQVGCFFRIAESAGLGKLVVGRKGASTRLEIEREKLSEHINAGPTAPPLSEFIQQETENEDELPKQGNLADPMLTRDTSDTPIETLPTLRVFITHGKNLELVKQVEAILQLSEIDYEVAIKEEATAIPVPEKIFGAMRRCTAGVIIVSKEQVQGDSSIVQINPNVLIEIGAAFVLYDRRVVLLWDKGMPIPSNLQGLYRCEFEGNELGWTEGMKLMKALKEFRK